MNQQLESHKMIKLTYLTGPLLCNCILLFGHYNIVRTLVGYLGLSIIDNRSVFEKRDVEVLRKCGCWIQYHLR